VSRELKPVVKSKRFDAAGVGGPLLDNGFCHLVRCFVLNLANKREPAFALYHGNNETLVIAADNRICFPMADLTTICDTWVAALDANAVWNESPSVSTACVAFSAFFLAPKIQMQRTPDSFERIDVPVDSFVTYAPQS
jgi:hypothetical protein